MKNSQFKINGRAIGPGHPCYIIAEAGSNHDQNLDKAIELVDIAAESRCDAVKFQTFMGLDIAAGPASGLTNLPEEFSKWGSHLSEFYAACALPREFHRPLKERANEKGIDFFSSPFGEWAVDFLADLEVPALKIASFEMVHLPLITYAAQTGIPLIISTGMASLGEIERALVATGENTNVALLHCGSNYPLSMAGANLAAMATMRNAFGVPIGYSDHTEGIAVPIAAAALGCNILEKHFTTANGGDGPDHSFALRPDALKEMVKGIRNAEAAIGSSIKMRQVEEEEHAQRGRRSIFTTCDIIAGTVLELDMLKIVRPGVGLSPFFLEEVLGRQINYDIKADYPLTWDAFLGKK